MRYSIRVVSTYPPRKCGIGTFSRDLTTAFGHFAADIASIRVAAIDKEDLRYSLPVDVVIDQYSPQSWRTSQDAIFDIAQTAQVPTMVILQHEYGIDPAGDGTDTQGRNYIDMAKGLREKGLIVPQSSHRV